MDDISIQAKIARAKGYESMCPGCRFEQKIPVNHRGIANHQMPNGSWYECHAGSEQWWGVPEFEEQIEHPKEPK